MRLKLAGEREKRVFERMLLTMMPVGGTAVGEPSYVG
jgi:hypothetical protein